MQTFGNVINGEVRQAQKTRHGVDPSTEEALPEVPISTQQDVDEAVSAARAAFPAWRKLTWDQRAEYINKLADAVEAHKDAFIDMIVRESGKPFSTAQIEYTKTITAFRVTSKLRLEDKVLRDDETQSATVRHVPLGVGAALVPWNWPVLLATHKIAPALMSGNCLIVKPSPFTPYSNIKMVELGISSLPPGVLQVLSGDDSLGPMLTEHRGIDKISFTGSTFTGKKVMESCSRTLKRVTLELGGNDPTIICEDADLEKTIPTVGTLSFLSSGQICMDVKRIYVHEKIYDQFKAALIDFASKVKTGPASDPEVLVGPIQNSMQYAKVQEMYAEIKKQGWNAVLGGNESEKASFEKGYFMKPTIIDNPPEDSRIVVEEPFGPIVPLLKWSDEEDVIRRANDTKMGLGASVWSRDIERAKRIASELEAGSVWVNSHFTVEPDVPFGGMKWSGMGRELGIEGLKSWTDVQSMWVAK